MWVPRTDPGFSPSVAPGGAAHPHPALRRGLHGRHRRRMGAAPRATGVRSRRGKRGRGLCRRARVDRLRASPHGQRGGSLGFADPLGPADADPIARDGSVSETPNGTTRVGGLRRTAPLTGGQVYYKSDALLDRLFASLAPPGILSLYHVSQQLYASASMVLNRAMVAPVVPQLSRLASLNESPSFTAQGPPPSGGDVQRDAGRFGRAHPRRSPVAGAHLSAMGSSLRRASTTCGGCSFSCPGLARRDRRPILSTSFYAQGDTRTPTRVGIVGFTLAIGLELVRVRPGRNRRPTVAASAYYLLDAAALLSV